MTINYNDLLTAEQKRSLVSQRITEFAAQAYQHSLNKKAFENIGDEAGVENCNKSIEVLESAIMVHQAELDSLPAATE